MLILNSQEQILFIKKKSSESRKCILIKILIHFFLPIILFFILLTKISGGIPFIKYEKNKIAMCTIVKNENRYVKYFIEFYRKLGYDHFYFYDHNDEGDESIDDVQIVKDGIKKGFITVIKYPDKSITFSANSYYKCYQDYNLKYDWISFFDVDEYLVLEPKNSSIKNFLKNPRYKNCEIVKFNWKVFTDNEKLDYEDKPLNERFPVESRFKFERRHVKSTIRGGLYYEKFGRTGSPHSLFSNIKSCSCSGTTTGWNYFIWPPDLKYASLNHYVTKTIKEYYFKRYAAKGNNMTNSFKRYSFDYFFKINKKTKEKVVIFNELFNTSYK